MRKRRDIFKINEATTSLINGEFILDCPDMALYKVQSMDSPVYKGSGYIKQSPNGFFEFKLFSQENFDRNFILSEMFSNKNKEGQIIPEASYYVVKATDLKNRKWKSKRICLPHRKFSDSGKGIVIFGEISTILHEEYFKKPIRNPTIKIQILDDVSFPADSPTEYSMFHKDQAIFKSMDLNAVEFEYGGRKFFLLKHDNVINISIVCQKGGFPDYFDTRVIEAFQFITARRIKKTITEIRENKKSKLRLQLIKETYTLDLIPPSSTPLWVRVDLFGNYLPDTLNIYQLTARMFSILCHRELLMS